MYGTAFCAVARFATAGLFLTSSMIATTGAQTADTTIQDIVVTAQRLDESRSHIQTQTGAASYTFDSNAIQDIPGGDNNLADRNFKRPSGPRLPTTFVARNQLYVAKLRSRVAGL